MSSLSDFLGEIGRHPLLTPEEELTMGRKVQTMGALVERCNPTDNKDKQCNYSDLEKKAINEDIGQ